MKSIGESIGVAMRGIDLGDLRDSIGAILWDEYDEDIDNLLMDASMRLDGLRKCACKEISSAYRCKIRWPGRADWDTIYVFSDKKRPTPRVIDMAILQQDPEYFKSSKLYGEWAEDGGMLKNGVTMANGGTFLIWAQVEELA